MTEIPKETQEAQEKIHAYHRWRMAKKLLKFWKLSATKVVASRQDGVITLVFKNKSGEIVSTPELNDFQRGYLEWYPVRDGVTITVDLTVTLEEPPEVPLF